MCGAAGFACRAHRRLKAITSPVVRQHARAILVYSEIHMTKPSTVTCAVCKQGTLRLGRQMFLTTDSFYACGNCHTEYHRERDKYRLKNIPSGFGAFRPFEGQLLGWEEIWRIANGGLSDAQLAKQEEEKKALLPDTTSNNAHVRRSQVSVTDRCERS